MPSPRGIGSGGKKKGSCNLSIMTLKHGYFWASSLLMKLKDVDHDVNKIISWAKLGSGCVALTWGYKRRRKNTEAV
jgi:hypothetical protein